MVTNTTVFTDSWNQLYTIISANTTDPTSKSKWIYSSFPDATHLTKADYPLIVINPIGSNTSETVVFNRDIKIFPLRVEIEIYSTSASQIDSITDDLFDAIESNISTLEAQELHNFELSNSDSDTVFRGKTRVHLKRIDWDFEYHRVA